MNVNEAIVSLSRLTGEDRLLFEIVENGKEPTASYSVDEITTANGFVILRSIN